MKDLLITLAPVMLSVMVALVGLATKFKLRTASERQQERLSAEMAFVATVTPGTPERALLEQNLRVGVARYAHDAKWEARSTLETMTVVALALSVSGFCIVLALGFRTVGAFASGPLSADTLASVRSAGHGCLAVATAMVLLAVVNLSWVRLRSEKAWSLDDGDEAWAALRAVAPKVEALIADFSDPAREESVVSVPDAGKSSSDLTEPPTRRWRWGPRQ